MYRRNDVWQAICIFAYLPKDVLDKSTLFVEEIEDLLNFFVSKMYYSEMYCRKCKTGQQGS
jgi:hypothetical protein